MNNNTSPARIGPHPPRMMTGRLPNTHRPEALYKRAGRLMCVAALARGQQNEMKKTKTGGWMDSIPEELKLPDVDTLEALSRCEQTATGPTKQRHLFPMESDLEAIRRRKVEADSLTRKEYQ
jgi:hypothetical protein